MTGSHALQQAVLFDGTERHRGAVMDVKIIRTGFIQLYGDPAIVNL